MEKAIPVLPCPDIKALADFYRTLGFEISALFTSPNPYAVVKYGELELNFWGSRNNTPDNNSSMCIIKVDNVDGVYESFATRLKKHIGAIPRTGIPRISKVRELSADRRFTVTDVGGNTLFILTPKPPGSINFFRTLENEKHARDFAVLYDLLYSREDPQKADKALSKYLVEMTDLDAKDRAKLLLVELETRLQLGNSIDDSGIKFLIRDNDKDDDWERIEQRYTEILHGK